MIHVPVFKKEVIKYLNVEPNKNFIDATIDGGGHAEEILKTNAPNGKLLGIDLNKDLLILAEKKLSSFKNRLILVEDNFSNLLKIIDRFKFVNISGILFDLGISNFYLEQSELGFSFQKENQNLDMRFSTKQTLTAKKILNNFSESEIYQILKDYGEEKFSKSIAKEISKYRKLKSINKVSDLNEIIKKSVPQKFLSKKIFARVYQALRIKINNELENFKTALNAAHQILNKNGRIVVISYHSLEDRIVKNTFREFEKNKMLEILSKKPIMPSALAIKQNPKSRSAKLRAAIKI